MVLRVDQDGDLQLQSLLLLLILQHREQPVSNLGSKVGDILQEWLNISQCFSNRTFFCVHVRKLGTSVRKSTTKTDLQNLPNQFRSEQTSLSFQKKIDTRAVVSLVTNRHACIDRDLAYEVEMLAFE